MNLGTGEGHSVKQVLDAVRQVTGNRVPFQVGPRRPGDPPALVADPSRAQELLHWTCARSLHDIVSTAWVWMQTQERFKNSVAK